MNTKFPAMRISLCEGFPHEKNFTAKKVMTLKISATYYGIILTVMRWSIDFWAPKTNLSGSP